MKSKVVMSTILFFFISLFGFLLFFGTMTSGYQFIDDHEFFFMKNALNTQSYFEVVVNLVKNDMQVRFRPFYYISKVAHVEIFGLNSFIYSINVANLGFLTFSLMFLTLRKLAFTTFDSILFVALTFVGSQMAVWWRLGPAEATGIFYLVIALYFQTSYFHSKKNIYKVLFFLFISISSLCKETFVLVIPAFTIFHILYLVRKDGLTLFKTIRGEAGLVFATFFLFLVEVVIIKFYVGTQNVGYAGIETNFTDFLNSFTANTFEISIYFFLILLLSLILFNPLAPQSNLKRFFKVNSHYLILSLLIIFPNFFAYVKSGMFERYLLPSTIGTSLIILLLLQEFKYLNNKLKWLGYALCVLVLCRQFKPSYSGAKHYAWEGKSFNSMLDLASKHSSKGINFVISPISGEMALALRIYLEDRKIYNYYITPVIDRPGLEAAMEYFKNSYKNRLIPSSVKPGVMVFMDATLPVYEKEMGDSLQEYEKVDRGNLGYPIFILKTNG